MIKSAFYGDRAGITLKGLFTSLLLGGLVASSAQAQVDPSLLSDLRARSIGPAGMSGRVTAIAAVEDDPSIIYAGTASGGLWKSTSAGLTWTPIFDDQPVASIGAVAIDPNSPDVVWVGTGEGNPRNSQSPGDGLYKSLDGGRTWECKGLKGTEHLHRVLLDPKNPDIAYVAALGPTWGESPHRGVYKTVDGGDTWEKILYVNDRTGAADLIMDPENPRKLLVNMWEHRRWPYFFKSGGEGSGLYMTLDGGENWTKLGTENGLPAGELGRMGLAFAPSDPKVVYALIEAKKSVVLRSDDGGFNFRTVNSDPGIANRPFYYADLRVDPKDPNRVYSLHSIVTYSQDGGRTFSTLVGWTVHPDHHAMWINPNDPHHIINGNDGGMAISRDHGRTWQFVSNLPLAQYYHIAIDNEHPYNVYGGMQDNGSWRGPSNVWENGGIRNHHWDEVGFGDGFNTLPDPEDAETGYAMSQGGYLMWWNVRTGERRSIRPPPPSSDVELRFNWDAGLAIDPFDPATIYYGSQFVHRSPDRGLSWEVISPDLTTNNSEWQNQAESGGLTLDVTGAENYTSILEVAPSPVTKGVLWVGTDDGRVHVTKDGGETWTSVEDNIHEVPKNTWVSYIEASHFDDGTAFVVFDDHRRSNWTPYVFKTTNFGETWTSLVDDSIHGYALVLTQDLKNENLLFLGTEFGLYVSLDGGREWIDWKHGYPTVSTIGLKVHPREHDLVIGTFGRSAYILDDISPLREMTPEVLAKPLHLFELSHAQQYNTKQTGASRFPGAGEFRGQTRANGAFIDLSINDPELIHPDKDKEAKRREPGKRRTKKATIVISDESGEEIQEIETQVHLGFNRVVWNLRRKPFGDQGGRRFSFGGPSVIPGTYKVKVSYGDHEAEGSLKVLADPRMNISLEDRRANMAAQERASKLSSLAFKAMSELRETEGEIDVILRKAKGVIAERKKEEAEEAEAEGAEGESSEAEGESADAASEGGEEADSEDEPKDPYQALVEQAEALKKELKALRDRLMPSDDRQGIVRRAGLMSQLQAPSSAISSTWEKPSPTALVLLDQAEELLNAYLADFNKVLDEDLKALREAVDALSFDWLSPREKLELDSEDGEG